MQKNFTTSRMKLLYRLFIFLILTITIFSTGINISQKAIEKPPVENEENYIEPKTKETYCTGIVKKVIYDIEDQLPGGNKQRSQQLLIEITSGPDKGKIRPTTNIIPDNPAFAIIGNAGKKYLITKVENLETGSEEYYVADYFRENLMWILIACFLITILLVGGFKGIRTIISLLITILLIAMVMIPLIEKGINPLFSAIIVSITATAITMVLVAGFNKKSLASTLATGIGVTISGIIAATVIKIAPLSGLSSSEAMILWGNQLYELNFKGLLASGMIVSSLGAVMDVAISIASSIQEVSIANPKYTLKELFNSGINVGRDIMGTMTSTLVLAYTGMALPLLLLIKNESNPIKYLNLELVASEITAAIAGSIGLIITIPAAALIMSYLKTREKG